MMMHPLGILVVLFTQVWTRRARPIRSSMMVHQTAAAGSLARRGLWGVADFL